MDDLISKQVLIEIIEKSAGKHPYKQIGRMDTYSTYNEGWTDAADDIRRSVEGIEAVQPWIPIAALEPSGAEHVLVTLEWSEGDYEVCECDWAAVKHRAESGLASLEKAFISCVVAWMPMPKPYVPEPIFTVFDYQLERQEE